ncbi:MAG: MFS transporter, partial [Gemmataceae bacterium]|nr:MFS transporter [Gemmataceae bacterium]
MPTPVAHPPPAGSPGAAHRWWALAAVECGNFVVYMDGFVVALALPAMARQFAAGLHVLKWVVVAYLLAVTVTLLPAGRLADLWGRKRVTIAGSAVLVAGSLLCMLAPTVETLIACRVVQGVGGGLVLATVMAEITAVFPKPERRTAMAANASILALAQVTGLVLGGLLIDQFGWRSVFPIVAAIGSVGLVLSWVVLDSVPRTAGRGSFDWLGGVLAVGAVGAPFLLVERFSHLSADPVGLALVAAAAAVVVLFVIRERQAPQPLLDLGLFRSRAFACGSAAAAFYFVAAVSCYFLLPLYAQVVLGLSPVRAGLLIVPLSVALTAISLTAGRLGGRFDARVLATAGLLCVSAALLGLSRLGPDATTTEVVWPLVVLGVGGGLFNPPNNAATLAGVPPGRLGVANGFLATARNFGQAIGAAVAATLLAQGLGPGGAVEALAGPAGARLGGPHL